MNIGGLIPFLQEKCEEMKIHCATGSDDIFKAKYAFLEGNFKNWQENQKNFGRKYILSLIYWNKDECLFAKCSE